MRLCGIDEGQCARVIEIPESHLFGIANFILGLFYYGMVMLWVILPIPYELHFIIKLAAWLVVGVSGYLAYVLLYEVNMPCRLCYVTYVLNLILAILI